MEKGCFVKDIKEGQSARGIYIASEVRKAQSRNGALYWCLKLADATGSIDAKIWSPLAERVGKIGEGAFVSISGRGSVFRDSLQIVLEDIRELPDAGGLPLSEFMPASPRNIAEMWDVLLGHCMKEFTYGPWQDFVLAVLGDEGLMKAFKSHPAAKSVHQAYAGGLLEHTLNVFEMCQNVATQYPELDRQTLLAAALFHDLGKIRELSGGVNCDYTDAGQLLGHIYLGVQVLEPYLAKSGLPPGLQEHLRHLILSHHGELEYGAVRVPQTAEAFVLHFIDNLDAKIAQCHQLVKDIPEGEFSARSSLLERRIYRPQPTPQVAIGQPQPSKEPPMPGDEEIPTEEIGEWQDWEAWESWEQEPQIWELDGNSRGMEQPNRGDVPDSRVTRKKNARNSCKGQQCSLLLKA